MSVSLVSTSMCQRRVLGGGEPRVVDRHRGVVDRGDGDGDRAGVGQGAVADRVGEAWPVPLKLAVGVYVHVPSALSATVPLRAPRRPR